MITHADSYTTEFTVDRTPDEVFAAVTDVRGWWSETITGGTARAGDEFSFTDQGIPFSRIRVTDAVPGRRVAWRVEDAYLAFVDDHDEWTGTTVTFELTPTASGTALRFTHHGLRPVSACYQDCSRGWDYCFTTSLRDLITTGTGRPISKATALGVR
jgi:uncharacterized protein YndB with AHSA1/START domain